MCLLKHTVLPTSQGKLNKSQFLNNLMSDFAPPPLSPVQEEMEANGGLGEKLTQRFPLLWSEAKLTWAQGRAHPAGSALGSWP